MVTLTWHAIASKYARYVIFLSSTRGKSPSSLDKNPRLEAFAPKGMLDKKIKKSTVTVRLNIKKIFFKNSLSITVADENKNLDSRRAADMVIFLLYNCSTNTVIELGMAL